MIWFAVVVYRRVRQPLSTLMFTGLLGFLGRLPRRIIWGSLGLYALIFIQYATANGIVPALHPVIALGLFWGSLILARKSLQAVFG